MKKRMKPYTVIGIRRKKCVRCGKQATEQWSICALGGRFVPVCKECDFLLNAIVIQFMGLPNQLSTMLKYQKEKK